MYILVIILAGLIVSAVIVASKRISGDETGFSREDERQKIILKNAALSSWQMILLYACIRLMNLVPFVNGFIDPTTIQTIQFFSNGGDILLIAALGYGMGAVSSYFRYS
ncbi:hypothetical protein VKA52_06150 [Halobacillus sp. HZG1]|uniref:hypothetical protein n=1 Tax=Halobacillus TaxID=45667 RepID=UPI00136CD61F|nr:MULTISPECIES: hypothetical protein [Halobacillus]MEC3883301.1 hypothetical protein [Halobacillus sp. HZG1]MYL30373.1 hypothetical protein [Halobacillus halophilus]